MRHEIAGLGGVAGCAGCSMRRGPLCPACAGLLRPPLEAVVVEGAMRATAAFHYEGVARALVLGLKLRSRRDYAAPLAEGMAAAVLRSGTAAGTITWVPAASGSVRARGFDHARVLAEDVARSLGLPASQLLVRLGKQRDQAGLAAPERRRNLEGAFGPRPGGKRVLLIDDLLTTGATATACTGALLHSGVKAVEVLVACRA